ncbi:MAG: type II toxin-antitoxin system RelE/ParE family toxin [Sulfuriferula multivorans]|uniref:Type II toxin-antitoxin system RelE/ParE family toxin n=1 Tax=Sulfuriferula multivorans TaxID=1559896 RepID=A0A7C9JX50_9PROT|nr:type II toxin-antitoxin system RelE/ParE family toxin [Sulfuriferula multivorans]
MSFQVVFLKSAELDLKELSGYMVKNFGKDAWQASYAKVKDAVNTIRTFPLGGNIPEELERLNLTQYRQVIAGMNRIIYEVRQEIIYIHIICDTRKDMKSILARRFVRIVST